MTTLGRLSGAGDKSAGFDTENLRPGGRLPWLTLEPLRWPKGAPSPLERVWNAADGSAGPLCDGRCRTEGLRANESGLIEVRRPSGAGSYRPFAELNNSRLSPSPSRQERSNVSAAISRAGGAMVEGA